MSQVVMLSASMATVSIMTDALNQVARENPRQAQALAALDLKDVVAECVSKAIDALLANYPDISRTDGPTDYGGRVRDTVDGLKVVTALKSEKFPRGLGIMLDKDGTVRYSGDTYGGMTRGADQLKSLFEEHLKIEIMQACAEILGYSLIGKETKVLADGDPTFDIELVKN